MGIPFEAEKELRTLAARAFRKLHSGRREERNGTRLSWLAEVELLVETERKARNGALTAEEVVLVGREVLPALEDRYGRLWEGLKSPFHQLEYSLLLNSLADGDRMKVVRLALYDVRNWNTVDCGLIAASTGLEREKVVELLSGVFADAWRHFRGGRHG